MSEDFTELRLQLKDLESKVDKQALRQDHHEQSDEQWHESMRDMQTQTLAQVTDFGRKLEKGFERIHTRIEEKAAKARHDLGESLGKVQGEVAVRFRDHEEKTASALVALTQRLQAEMKTVERTAQQSIKVWVLGGCVVVLLGCVSFFLAQRFETPHPIGSASAAVERK